MLLRTGRIRLTLCSVVGKLVLAAFALSAFPAQANDYLSDELREEVDALVRDVAATPTSAVNAAARADMLLRWVNAWSLTGGYVPVNLTLMARPVLPQGVGVTGANQLDGFVRELALHDSEPEAFGELSSDLGPFVARDSVTFRQVWRVGSRGMQRGGGLAVPKHFMLDHPELQAGDPAAPGYVTLTSSNDSAEFSPVTVPLQGMHGGFRGATPVLFFKLIAGSLQQGDTLTVTYGDRHGGGPGLVMPTLSSDRMPFPLYVALDDGMHLLSLPIQPVRVVGGKVAGVHGFAPSVIKPGADFELSIRAEDKYYNRATGPLPEWQLMNGDEVLAKVAAGNVPITVLDSVRLAEAGVYHLQLRSSDGSIKGDVNPILVSDTAQSIYWGDTHGHSGFAEGIGTPERFMTWARDDARLDYVTHSEHDIWLDDFEWNVLRENVTNFSTEGRFIAYLGYEWSTRNFFGGHHNVLFRTAKDRKRVPTQRYPTLSDLYAGLRAQHKARDVVVIPHAHQAGDYRLSDPKLEPLIEIMSQHGNFEWFGRNYLSRGHQVGFTAASDNHLSQPGYGAPKGGSLSQRGGLGAVLAPELTRDALFDAMKNRQTYATTGERMILDLTINGAGMGERTEFAKERAIEGRVIGTAPIHRITLLKNNAVLWDKKYGAAAAARGKTQTFDVQFSSRSEPLNPGDNPRGWVPWKGSLQVENAELVAAELLNPGAKHLQGAVVDPNDANRASFETFTRGSTSTVRISLKDLSRKTRLGFAIDSGREFGGGPPVFRKHAGTRSASFKLTLPARGEESVSRDLPAQDYTDSVAVRRVDMSRSCAKGDCEQTLGLSDTSNVQGDYYYLRVEQENNAIAWSSPIWIGGFGPR